MKPQRSEIVIGNNLIEFEVMIIKMLTRLERRGEELSENFNKVIEYIKRTNDT